MTSAGQKVKGAGKKPTPAEVKAFQEEKARRESVDELKQGLITLVSSLRVAKKSDAEILAVVRDKQLHVSHGLKKEVVEDMLREAMGQDHYRAAVAELKLLKAKQKPGHPLFPSEKVAGKKK